MNKQKLLGQVKELKEARQEACRYGNVFLQQEINYSLVGIAKKLRVDYYSL